MAIEETSSLFAHKLSLSVGLRSLITRLSPPSLPTTLVVRERLLTALDTALSRPLTLLSASAGWGKTTLLSAWAHGRHEAVAWLSLEALDNDPTRFWVSLIAALRRCWPTLGERALALLQAPGSLSPGLTTLLNEMADRGTQTSPMVLILDDYHVIDEPTIHASFTFWLEHLPSHVHLLLASRVDPDLPLSRFRARGHLGEIRDTDLRFTQAETDRFLTQSMGLALSESEVALLEGRTEGWIASLHLAALVLQKHADPSASVHALSGSQRVLLDYMREEILASLSPDLQDFLLQTSWLNPLSASLCDAVRGREDSARLLEQVERANLFLQPLDESRQWYRYHALWTQAMQHEAQLRLGAATVRGLHSKASHWYERQQMLPEAIEAALTSEEFVRTALLIERFLISNSFRNAYYTLCRWLGHMPEEIVQARPFLSEHSLMYPDTVTNSGIEAFLAGEMDVAWQHFLEGGRRAKSVGSLASAFVTTLLLGEACLEKGELHRASRYYDQALAYLDEDQKDFQHQFMGSTKPFFASWIYHDLAALAYEQNESETARRYLSQALALREKPEEEVHVRTSGALIHARLLHASGAKAQAQEMLSTWERHARFPWSVRAIRTWLMAIYRRSNNRLRKRNTLTSPDARDRRKNSLSCFSRKKRCSWHGCTLRNRAGTPH